MATTLVDEYVIYYSSNSFWPRIALKNGGKFIGQLNFKANGGVLPVDVMSGTQAQLFYHLDDFQNAIDLLRNEKPIYLMYNGSGGAYENGLVSGGEPAGEGE